ncbi:DnaJ C-terminal domain-containing protein [Oenococcus oeni]|uniref:DnaJ C-terminal domain-containing protein n=2 Tax=Oenococcus oeni TaxID=1247 RepID=UPI0008F8FEC2|nr:DnaJ C-terminal domain-containing protein [Oenococcus oeni]MDV7687481.1 DnaJ domain-containing protein [Oenococcus oeni]OIM25968.1 molecular chaperone DnaJ [Oenococcus oeni]SYW07691.1 co-factor of molecular chaperone DnaK [Oenococcus oeni]SYW14104.1 co-factor of molecular chaperone DnaK [Oenococcus oeni]
MDNEEYYKILGVAKSASQDEIKHAYRKMSKKYHPDLNHQPGAEDKYKQVQEAYETLGDPQKRAAYDQYGKAGANANNGQGGFGGFQQSGFNFNGQDFGDFSDIFSQMFGGSFNPNAPRKGRDLQYRINLTFEEAVFGKETEIKYVRQESGGNSKEHTVKVTIPAGVETGQQMRLAGQGEAGTHGGPYGDLYVEFIVGKSKDGFERQGANIYLEEPINFVQAALGDKIKVKTVHGDVELTIPAGTQTDTEFRLRGKGAPYVNSSRIGDEYVKVIVQVPKRLNEKEKKALKTYADLRGENVNPQKRKGLFG